MAVITPFELDDVVTTSEASREANSTHGRFSAGTAHAHHVH